MEGLHYQTELAANLRRDAQDCAAGQATERARAHQQVLSRRQARQPA